MVAKLPVINVLFTDIDNTEGNVLEDIIDAR
jgi:hypothetical protein